MKTNSFSSRIPDSLRFLDKILWLPIRLPYHNLIISRNIVTCQIMTSIRDQFAFNIDVYPKTLNSAYELMQKS